MKKFIFVYSLMTILTMSKLMAQSFDCLGLSASRYYLNDTIHVRCDTVYLLNKVTYSFYKDHLKKINTADPKLKELVGAQNELIKLYEKRISDLNMEYDQVRKTLGEDLKVSTKFIETSNNDLTGIKSSLSKLQSDILTAKDGVNAANGILKEEVHKARASNWKWGAGGLVFGVVVGLLINKN